MKRSRFLSFLINVHLVWYILGFIVLKLLINLVFMIPGLVPEDAFENDSVTKIRESGEALLFFMAVIFAPLFETALFQFPIIKISRLLIKKPKWSLCVGVILSAIIFSLDHTYSIYYALDAFLMGLVLGFAFYIGIYRKEMPAFFIVAIIHSLWNLLIFILEKI